MKDLVILGAGGCGRDVLWLIKSLNNLKPQWNILGFVDDNLNKDTKCDTKVIGNIEWLASYPEALDVVVCIGPSIARRKIVDRVIENKNLSFPNIIAPTVRMSDLVNLGKGIIIFDASVISVNIEINDFVIINVDCTVGHDAILNKFVTLYPSVNVCGNVTINENAEIGTGAIIIPGKKIGDNTIIGAGAVVIKDIQSNCTAVGNPAQVVKFHDNKL